MVRLAITLFLLQCGYHAFTASMPVALTGAGVSDPTIGLIVGSAAAVQVPAAFLAGALLDRFGGVRILYAGAIAYLLGSLIVLAPVTEPGDSTLPFFAARIFQGIGLAGTLPAALSLVPNLVPGVRRGLGLAFINSAHNLTIVALPPLSLAVLGWSSLHGVALGAIAVVLLGLVVGLGLPRMLLRANALSQEGTASTPWPSGQVIGTPASRTLGFAFRRSWLGPLLVVLLYVIHWGVLTAYLPSRAQRAGADIGLFFAADGAAILLSRLPVGWLTDRVSRHWLVLVGLVITLVAVVVVLPPPTTTVLVISGALTGIGAGFALTPNLLELSHRSGESDRGSAFSLFSAALAAALVVGSIGSAPVVVIWGFEGAAIAAIGGLILSAVVVIWESSVNPNRAARRRLV